MTTYGDLRAPWQRAVDLAWESFVAGSLGIGAVVTDRSGAVVSAGRNRITESTGPPGHLFGSRLAHAELDALAGLGTDRTAELVLWTTLEPCLLCAGGIVLCDIRDVRYAASDPLWFGAERLSDLNDFLAARWPERTGPVDGPLATFGALLPLLWFLRVRGEDHVVAQTYARDDPHLLDHARTLAVRPTILPPTARLLERRSPRSPADASQGEQPLRKACRHSEPSASMPNVVDSGESGGRLRGRVGA